jgi:hypothetical protein
MPHALEAENNKMDVFVFRAAFFETTIEFRSGAKKELALEVIKQHRRASGTRSLLTTSSGMIL